jgi:hypothetical protein
VAILRDYLVRRHCQSEKTAGAQIALVVRAFLLMLWLASGRVPPAHPVLGAFIGMTSG